MTDLVLIHSSYVCQIGASDQGLIAFLWNFSGASDSLNFLAAPHAFQQQKRMLADADAGLLKFGLAHSNNAC
jgi:hypothetical protein